MENFRPSPLRSIYGIFLAGALPLLLLPATQGLAQTTATTDPVGYTALPLLANSDSLISIPFTRPVEFTGAIGSVSGNTITLATSPGFTANQYQYTPVAGKEAKTFYAIIGPNISTLTGTVALTNGMTSVTGTGTAFGTAGQVAVNDELLINGLAYNVSAIASTTALTLSRAYTGTSGSALTATFDHSPREGSYYTVTSNDTGTVTVNLNGDTLSAVTAGTSMSLIPYWTLGTAFPTTTPQNPSFVPSTGTSTRFLQTEILLPDVGDPGINLAPPSTFYNYNSAWRLYGATDVTVSYDDTILPPTTYFIVRNAAAATTFTPVGGVYLNRLSTPLDTQSLSALGTQNSLSQDNAVAVPRPVAVTLNDLGLITSGAFETSTGTSSRNITDTLLTFANTTASLNKSSNATYYYYNNGWRLFGGDVTVDYGATIIPYGLGFIIRKAPVAGGATSFSQNTRTY